MKPVATAVAMLALLLPVSAFMGQDKSGKEALIKRALALQPPERSELTNDEGADKEFAALAEQWYERRGSEPCEHVGGDPNLWMKEVLDWEAFIKKNPTSPSAVLAFIPMSEALSRGMPFEEATRTLRGTLETISAKYKGSSLGVYAEWRLWNYKRQPYLGGGGNLEDSKRVLVGFEEWYATNGQALRDLDKDPLWQSYFHAQRANPLDVDPKMDVGVDLFRASWCYDTGQNSKAVGILNSVQARYKGTKWDKEAQEMKRSKELLLRATKPKSK